MNAPPEPCLDCGKPTWQPDGKSEWYMVQDRLLFAGDFTGSPVNRPRREYSDRLNDRLVREPCESS